MRCKKLYLEIFSLVGSDLVNELIIEWKNPARAVLDMEEVKLRGSAYLCMVVLVKRTSASPSMPLNPYGEENRKINNSTVCFPSTMNAQCAL